MMLRNMSLPLHLEVVQVPEIRAKTPQLGVLDTSRTQRWFKSHGLQAREVPLSIEAMANAVYNALDVRHEGIVEWRIVRLVFKMVREFLVDAQKRRLLGQLMDRVGCRQERTGHLRRDTFVKLVLPFASKNPDFFEALPFRTAAQTVLRRLELRRVFNIGKCEKEEMEKVREESAAAALRGESIPDVDEDDAIFAVGQAPHEREPETVAPDSPSIEEEPEVDQGPGDFLDGEEESQATLSPGWGRATFSEGHLPSISASPSPVPCRRAFSHSAAMHMDSSPLKPRKIFSRRRSSADDEDAHELAASPGRVLEEVQETPRPLRPPSQRAMTASASMPQLTTSSASGFGAGSPLKLPSVVVPPRLPTLTTPCGWWPEAEPVPVGVESEVNAEATLRLTVERPKRLREPHPVTFGADPGRRAGRTRDRRKGRAWCF